MSWGDYPARPKTNHEPFKVEEEGRGESQRDMTREGLEAPLLALKVETGSISQEMYQP